MIVMRDEQFAAHGIERKNKQRRNKEVQAKAKRAQAPVVNHRVDTSKPAFSKPRASHSNGGGGGGSINLLFLAPFVLLGLFRRRLLNR